MKTLWITWLALMTVASAEAPGLEMKALGAPPATEAELDSRVEGLTTRLRCPVCQGLNVAESRSEAALAMTARIRELVEQGYTQEQVIEYFTDRYGDWVLLDPPRTGINWLLWSGPFVLLLVGGTLIVIRFRKTAKSSTAVPDTALEQEHSDENPYVAQLLAELEEKP